MSICLFVAERTGGPRRKDRLADSGGESGIGRLSFGLTETGGPKRPGLPLGVASMRRLRARLRSPSSTPKALDVRRHPTFRDWTAIAYLAAGIALLVCLADMLR